MTEKTEKPQTLRGKYMKVLAEVPNFITDEVANAGSRTYKYLNLATILKNVKPIFAKHGLMFEQPLVWREGQSGTQYATVETIIFDETDELHVGSYPVIVTGDPQALGSAVTYARRYALYAALGIFPDKDDDGAAAKAAMTTDGITREYASTLSQLAKAKNVNLLQFATQVTGRTIARLGELRTAEGEQVAQALGAL